MDTFMKRKERVILTAIEIISELGFQGLSTKEITKRQEISDGTLYKHFKSKDDIILGILDYYSKFDESIKESIEMNNLSAKEGIIYFFSMMTEYYENYPTITALSNLQETLDHEVNISKRSKQIFEDRYSLIEGYIEKGKKDSEIRVDVDSELLADILLGSVREIILKWRINKFNFHLKEKVIITIKMILKACENK